MVKETIQQDVIQHKEGVETPDVSRIDDRIEDPTVKTPEVENLVVQEVIQHEQDNKIDASTSEPDSENPGVENPAVENPAVGSFMVKETTRSKNQPQSLKTLWRTTL